MAIRAWLEGDLRLAIRLLEWANPNFINRQNANNEVIVDEYNVA